MAMKRKVAVLVSAAAVPAMIAGMTPAVASAQAAPGTITIEVGSEVEDTEIVLAADGQEVANTTVKNGVATFNYTGTQLNGTENLTLTVDGDVELSDAECVAWDVAPGGGTGGDNGNGGSDNGGSDNGGSDNGGGGDDNGTGGDDNGTGGDDNGTGGDDNGTPDDGDDQPNPDAAGKKSSGVLASAAIAAPGLTAEERKGLEGDFAQGVLDAAEAKGGVIEGDKVVIDGEVAFDIAGLGNLTSMLGPLLNGVIDGTGLGDLLRPILGTISPILKPIIDIVGIDTVKMLLDTALMGMGVPPGVAGTVVDILWRLMQDPDADISDLDPSDGGDTTAPTTPPPSNGGNDGEGTVLPVSINGSVMSFDRAGNSGVECNVTASLVVGDVDEPTSLTPSPAPVQVQAPAPAPVSAPGVNYGPKVETGGTVDSSLLAKIKSIFA